MGSIFSKICCCRKKAKKQDEKQLHIQQPVEEESDVRVVTNLGGTIDKTTDSSEPQDASVKKKNKPVDIASITIGEKSTSIPEPTQKVNKINDEKQKKKEKKKKKIVDSSSDSTSSSSSDSDSHIEKKYKRKNKDGSYTKVYSKTTFSAGTKINIVKGNNITINDNKTIIKNNPQKKTKESTQLFTQMFTEQSARQYQTDLFNQTGPFVNGGSFIDLTKHNLVEEVRILEILTKCTKSVGILKSPGGTSTCFRVGSKYIMTALHAIQHMITPEFRELQDNDTDWRTDLRNLCRLDTFVDFEYLTEGGHIERNKFFFKLDETNSVPFYDESTDSIVLELECDQDHQLPPPFKVFGLPMLNNKFSLVHHAGGQSKKVEPVDKIVDIACDRTRTDIQTIQQLSETFLTHHGIDVARFCCERPPFCIIRNLDRLLFHCASNKGASGCPGIQVTKDGTVVVVTMLLCGYPDWYYSAECQTVANLWSKSNTVEQGVNFASIFTLMKLNNPRLFDDVFNIRTVQAVPRDS